MEACILSMTGAPPAKKGSRDDTRHLEPRLILQSQRMANQSLLAYWRRVIVGIPGMELQIDALVLCCAKHCADQGKYNRGEGTSPSNKPPSPTVAGSVTCGRFNPLVIVMLVPF